MGLHLKTKKTRHICRARRLTAFLCCLRRSLPCEHSAPGRDAEPALRGAPRGSANAGDTLGPGERAPCQSSQTLCKSPLPCCLSTRSDSRGSHQESPQSSDADWANATELGLCFFRGDQRCRPPQKRSVAAETRQHRQRTRFKIGQVLCKRHVHACLAGSQMTLQTRTKTEGATGLFTVTAARLPELIDEIGIGKFQIIQFLPVLFVPLCEGANVLVPREALEQKPQSLPKPQSLSFS